MSLVDRLCEPDDLQFRVKNPFRLCDLFDFPGVVDLYLVPKTGFDLSFDHLRLCDSSHYRGDLLYQLSNSVSTFLGHLWDAGFADFGIQDLWYSNFGVSVAFQLGGAVLHVQRIQKWGLL